MDLRGINWFQNLVLDLLQMILGYTVIIWHYLKKNITYWFTVKNYFLIRYSKCQENFHVQF